MRHALVRFTIAAAVAAASSAFFAGASFAAPCWQQVVNDWFDNSRVDSTYPISCYQQALANLPEDMRAYSSAPDDIARARDDALRADDRSPSGFGGGGGSGGGGSGGGGGSDGSSSGLGGMRTFAPDGSSSSGEENPSGGAGTASDAVVAPESGGVLREALDRVGPADPSSVPIPLLVLGAVALLLVAAGASALLARRLRASKPQRDTA